jgi:hypothetical protein
VFELIKTFYFWKGNLHHCWECSGKECENDKLDEKYQRICPSLTEKQEKLGLRPVCVKYRAENGIFLSITFSILF